jgi:hypothetical protein
MRLLDVHRVADRSLRTAPDMWFATMTFKLSPQARARLPVDFEEFEDDLDSGEFAYIDVEGVPASLQRYANEPADIYTLQVDVSRIQETWKVSVLAFSEDLLFSLRIPREDILWVNHQASESLRIPADYSVGDELMDLADVSRGNGKQAAAPTDPSRPGRKR